MTSVMKSVKFLKVGQLFTSGIWYPPIKVEAVVPPEDHNLNAHRRQNLRSHFMKLYLKNLNAFFAQRTLHEYIMRSF